MKDKKSLSKIVAFFRKYNNILVMLCLIISIFAIAYSVFEFMRVFHNIDLAYNALKDPYREQIIYDEIQPGEYVMMRHMYIMSMTYLLRMPLLFMLSAFSAGMAVQWFLINKK